MPAIHYDGLVSRATPVKVAVEAGGNGPQMLVIRHADVDVEVDRWAVDRLYTRPARRHELRIGSEERPAGARIIVVGEALVTELENLLPGLGEAANRRRRRERRVLFSGVAALAAVIAAFIVVLPHAVGPIAALIPPSWEESTGAVAEQQLAQVFQAGEGFTDCSAGPDSDLAHQALDRFSADAVAGIDTPFTPRIRVVRSNIDNAFTLPGGRIIVFSGLLTGLESPDELAGVLAHEIGHMVARDGMKSVISATATGFFTGFISGDLTGTSVAGSLGAAILQSRFSQGVELDADRFAADTARRLGFDTAGLADMLMRLGATRSAFSLLDSHPPAPERQLLLMRTAGTAGPTPIFSSEEWQAIKQLCGD